MLDEQIISLEIQENQLDFARQVTTLEEEQKTLTEQQIEIREELRKFEQDYKNQEKKLKELTEEFNQLLKEKALVEAEYLQIKNSRDHISGIE